MELLGDIPEARQFMKDDREVLLSGQEKLVTSEPVPVYDGQIRWFTTLKMPFIIPGTEEKALLFIATDISEQKKLQLILQKQKSELKESNEEMEAMNEELKESIQEAQKANKAKTEFLATMSHELRTPLNGILGFSQILRKTHLEEYQGDFVDIIIQSANNLLGIISDILDFSIIDTNKLRLKPEKTNICKIVEQTLKLIKNHANEKGLSLIVDVEKAFPKFVEVDPLRFNQVLLNLLSNAVKFTNHGIISLVIKKRSIDYEQKKVHLHFSIKDTGIGIKKEHQSMIFDAFSQVDMSNTRKYEGIGLGLSISKQLLNKMGSDLQLESTLGEGSDFSFDLVLPYYDEVPEIESDAVKIRFGCSALKKNLAGKRILITAKLISIWTAGKNISFRGTISTATSTASAPSSSSLIFSTNLGTIRIPIVIGCAPIFPGTLWWTVSSFPPPRPRKKIL